MTKRKRIEKLSKHDNRCLYSGKLIRRRPAVLEQYCVPYVKKQGFLVSNIKFFIFLFLFVNFFIAPINVIGFDSLEKVYYSENQTVLIKDGGDSIASITLDTPLYHRVIDRGVGIYQPVAEFTINTDLDNSDFLKKVDFYDVKKGMSGFSRDYYFMEKVLVKINEVRFYEEDCINRSDYSTCTKIYTHSEYDYDYEYKSFDFKDKIKSDSVTVSLFVDVQPDEIVEWIPTFLDSLEVREWAVWDEGLRDGLVYYYRLNESSGTNAEDIRGIELGNQLNGTTVIGDWVSGILGNGWFGDETSSEYILINSTDTEALTNGYTAMSVSFWINGSTDIHGCFLCNGIDPNFFNIRLNDADRKLQFYMKKTGEWGSRSNSPLSPTDWTHVVVSYNGSPNNVNSFDVYINGSLMGMSQWVSGLSAPIDAGMVTLGRGLVASSDYYIDETIDEVAIWNRTLNSSEVADLYNSGNGITYTLLAGSVDEEYPTFINYWSNNASFNGSGIALFNVTVISTNGTVYLEIGGSNYSGSGIGDVYNFSVSLTNGTYSYYYNSFGNGTSSNYNRSETLYYTVNDTPYSDTIYPLFFNNSDNSGDFNVSGTATFSLNITYTNGSVYIIVDGINYTASNSGGDSYNYSMNLTSGTYEYYWFSYGNGTNENYNRSESYYYTVPTGLGADSTLFEVDFTENITIAMFYILFAIATIMFLLGYIIFAGSLASLLGFVLLFSGFNSVISFVVIVMGVLIVISGK